MKLRIFRTLIACASIFTISAFADAPNAPVRVQRSVADVVKLSKGRVSGEVLLLYIKNNRAGYSLSADEILYLKEQNVPEEAITEMLHNPPRTVVTANTPPQNSPPVAELAPAPAQQQVVVQQPPPTVVQAQPQVTYVSSPPVYVYDSPYYYPYYSSYWWSYPAVSLSFGWGRGYYGHFGHNYYGGHYASWGGGVHNYAGYGRAPIYRSGGFSGGIHSGYSRGGGFSYSGRGGHR